MTGEVTGSAGNYSVNIGGQEIIVTPEDLYIQEIIDQFQENQELGGKLENALGRPYNENDLQLILKLMAHPELASKPEYEQFQELIGALEELVANELGFGENWQPNVAKLKLAVFRRSIPAGKFNEVVKKLAKGPPPLSEGEKNALLQLFSNSQSADSVNPEHLNQLLGALLTEYEETQGTETAPLTVGWAAETGEDVDMNDLIGTKAAGKGIGGWYSQRTIDNLQTDVPTLLPDESSGARGPLTSFQLEAAGKNPWFGSNMLVALFENILGLLEIMKDVKRMETELQVNMIGATVQMAKDIARLTIASSELEAKMLRAKATQLIIQGATNLAMGAAMGGMGWRMRANPERLMAMAGSMQAINDALNKGIEAGFTFHEANLKLEKGVVDSVKEFLQQIISILQQEQSKASESYKQIVEQMAQLIQQFNKWVDEHYQAHNFSRG